MTLILGLALILRLVLFNQSLWLDEAIEALALMGRQGPLLKYALADFQPPLYHFIGYFNTHLFGYSEIALRLPSLLCGLATVYFMIKIADSIASRHVGLIAGLLVATNPLLIYYSQEGRTYAMTCLFVTASFYYFMQLLRKKYLSKLCAIYYVLFTTAFLWTSYLAWFVLLAQGVYVLWKKRYDILAFQAIAGLTLLAWLPSFLTSLGIGHSTLSGSPEWGRVVGGLTWKSLPLTWIKFNLGRIGFDNKIFYGVLVAGVGLLHLAILRTVPYKKYLILLIWLIPPIFLGLITASILPIYSYFRVLFVLPAYLLLLALGSTKLSKIVIGLNILFLVIFWLSPRYHREDWRSLVSNLPANIALAMPSRAQSAPLFYYSRGQDIIEPSHDLIVGNPIYYIRYVEDIFDVRRVGAAKLQESGYTITNQLSYPGIAVDIYTK